MTAILETPIALEWLAANGFTLLAGSAIYRLRLTTFHTLSIDVCAADAGEWHMYVASGQIVYVRRVRWTWEVEKLAEGLSGKSGSEIQEGVK